MVNTFDFDTVEKTLGLEPLGEEASAVSAATPSGLSELSDYISVLEGLPKDDQGLGDLIRELPFESKLSVGRSVRENGPNSLISAVQAEFSRDRTILGEPGRGLVRGVQSLGDFGLGLGALAAGAFGADETVADIGATLGERQLHRGITSAPLQEFEGAFDNPGNFAAWLAGLLGEQAPNVATIILGGGVGTLIGKSLLTGAIKRETANRAINFAIRNSGEIGVFAAASAIETGATSVEQLEATGTVNVPVAVIAGVAKGALEGLTPLAIAGSFGIVDSVLQKRFLQLIANRIDDVKARPTRALLSAIQVAPVEGVTEFMQEVIDLAARDFVDENFDALGPETRKRLLESSVSGFFAGGGFGGVAGLFAPQIGVSPDAPLARFTDDETGGKVAPPPVAADDAPPTTHSVEPIDETVPFVFADEDGALVGRDEGTPLEFNNGVRGIQNLALNRRGNQKTRFFRVEDEAGADKSALLLDLPTTVDDLETAPGVTLSSEEATQKASDAIAQRNFALESQARGATASFTNQMREAQKLYQEALDLGFRVEPKEGDGFVLAKKADLREVKFAPTNFKGTPTSRFAFGFESLREVIVNVPPFLENIVPLGTRALVERVGVPVEQAVGQKGSKTFSVDVTRLPQEQLRVGSRLAFKRIIENIEAEILEQGGPIENSQRKILDKLVKDGLITFSSESQQGIDVQFDLLEEALAETDSDQADSLFQRALKNGAEIRPLEVTAENVAGLFFEGSPQSVEFLLAATRVPRFPSFLSGRRENLASFGTNSGLSRFLDSNYEPRTKSGKSIDLDKLTARLTIVFAQGGLDNRIPVDSKDIGGVRLQALSLFKKFNRQFPLKDKVVFLFTNTTVNGGFFVRSLEGVTVISINTRTFQGPSLTKVRQLSVVDTVAHEFGHALMAQELAKVSGGEISQLMNAYIRDLFRAELLPVGGVQQQYGAIPDFISPALVETVQSAIKENQTLAEGFTEGDLQDYLLNFDEWLANNMSKWALDTSVEPTTSLERVLQRMARLLKKFFAEVVKSKANLFAGIEDFSVDLEFKKFLERIREKQGEMGKPVSQMLPSEGQKKVKYSPMLNAPYEETAAVSPSRKLIDFVVKNAKGITPGQKKRLKETATNADYFNGLMKWGMNILQVARLNPAIEFLQRYVAQTRKWHTESTQWKARASETIRKWQRLGKVQADALGKFVFEIDQMTYMSEAEHVNKKFRRPTADELNAIAKRHGLSEQAKDVYQLLTKDFDDFLRVIETVEMKRIQKEFEGAPGRETQLRKVEEEFNRLRARPYFPHARFGQFAVVVKDTKGKTVYMEQIEGPLFSIGKKSAEKRRRDLKEKLSKSMDLQTELGVEGGFTIGIAKIPEQVQPFRGMPPTILRLIESRLELTPEQKLWLKDLIVDQSPTASFRKRLGKRENIPGYSQDAQRSYADYFWHGSNYLARLTHGQDMQETLLQAEQEISTLLAAGEDTVKRRQIVEYLQDHFSNIMNPGPDWAQLRSASFSWWLGFVPASAILNLTQVPIVALPYLSNRFGTAGTLNALRKAYRDIVKLNRDPVKALEETSDRLFKSLALAMKQGFIDESWATEIAATATGGNLMRMQHGNLMSRAISQIGQASSWMFQASEAKVNRRVVFRAAMELATANPQSEHVLELVRLQRDEFNELVKDEGFTEVEAKAFLAGRDAVDRTQFEYANWARPRFMRGRLGVLFMFFMFVQNSTFFAVHEPGRLRYMLMLMAMAGIMGLPGAEDMAAIAQFIGRRLGFQFNVEEEVSRFVVDNFGGDLPPDLLLHGASRFGFGIPAAADLIGIPLPVFDMSASIGMGRLIPGVSELGSPGLDFNRKFSEIGTDIAGATFGIGINFLKMMSDIETPWTDPKRWERGMPRALKNVIKASRFATEGRERDRGGATIAEFNTDEFEDIGEILLAGAGFQPQKLTRIWDRKAAQREAENYWSMRRGILMKQFSIAVMAEDKQARNDMVRAIKRYNDDVPFGPMRITRDSLTKSIKARRRRNRLIEAGISPTKMFQPLSRDIARVFPGDKGGAVDVQDVSRIR